MDVGRAIFLNSKQFDFLGDNLKAVRASATVENASESDFNVKAAEKQFRHVSSFITNVVLLDPSLEEGKWE